MLADSNTIIYSARPEFATARQFVVKNVSAVSSITIVEVLGYHLLKDSERLDFEDFFRHTRVFHTTDLIIGRAVHLGQGKKMGLADAIIAATAVIHRIPLITRNVSDFKGIIGLRLINPFEDT